MYYQSLKFLFRCNIQKRFSIQTASDVHQQSCHVVVGFSRDPSSPRRCWRWFHISSSPLPRFGSDGNPAFPSQMFGWNPLEKILIFRNQQAQFSIGSTVLHIMFQPSRSISVIFRADLDHVFWLQIWKLYAEFEAWKADIADLFRDKFATYDPPFS